MAAIRREHRLTLSLAVIIYGVVHSQIVLRFTIGKGIKPGKYPHNSADGRIVGVKLTADSIFKSLIKVYTFIPFIWGMFIFPYGMRLYGLKTGKNVHIATNTYIETAGLVEIGDNSFIGYGSNISAHVHENREIVIAPIKIGHSCYIGAGTVLSKNLSPATLALRRATLKQTDYKKQLDFLLKVRDEVSRANKVIIDIRKIKSDLDFLMEKVSDKVQIVDLINKYKSDLDIIENNIHMTKNQSRQDPLNYGIRINNRIAFLLADSQRGDYPPTEQAQEFFESIKGELNEEISKFNRVLNTYTMQLNNMIQDNDIKFISY